MLRKWLYPVPFPAPGSDMVWRKSDGNNCSRKEIQKLIPYKCFEKNTQWDRKDTDLLNMFKSCHYYYIGIRKEEFGKIRNGKSCQ